MGIILDTLICFSKICDEKEEPALFKGNENSSVYNFFYRMSQKYPDELKDLIFLKGEGYYFNLKLEEEWNYLKLKREVNSWGRDHHPFETSKGMSKLYEKVKNKETLDKIAQDFYNELGCDKNGIMRNKVVYDTVDFLII